MKIHVWAPDTRPEQGGIQGYSQQVVAALECAPGVKSVRVLTRNTGHPRFFGTRPCGAGVFPKKLQAPAFALLAIWHALRERPDCIWCTLLNFAPVARLLKRFLGIPYVVSLHGVEAWNLSSPPRRRALRTADELLPVGEYTLGRVAGEQGISRENFFLLPNTFDEHAFTPGEKPPGLIDRYAIQPGERVLLSVGRLDASDDYKGFDRVMQALVNLETRVRYLIVGDGSDRPRLERLASTLGLEKRVVFAGRQNRSELVAHYRLCDAFAMPSTGEGFGIVYLEAMACGKPVLAGHRDGGRDALLEGRLGRLVDPTDIEEITTALRELLAGSNPAAIRENAVRHFGQAAFRSRIAEWASGFRARRHDHANPSRS